MHGAGCKPIQQPSQISSKNFHRFPTAANAMAVFILPEDQTVFHMILQSALKITVSSSSSLSINVVHSLKIVELYQQTSFLKTGMNGLICSLTYTKKFNQIELGRVQTVSINYAFCRKL